VPETGLFVVVEVVAVVVVVGTVVMVTVGMVDTIVEKIVLVGLVEDGGGIGIVVGFELVKASRSIPNSLLHRGPKHEQKKLPVSTLSGIGMLRNADLST